VAGVALHAVKPAAVNRHDCALHINEIILAQSASNPFLSDNYCAIFLVFSRLVSGSLVTNLRFSTK
jgi:hypothetical protein